MQRAVLVMSILTVAVGFLLRPLVTQADTCNDENQLKFDTAYECEVIFGGDEQLGTFALTFFDTPPGDFSALSDEFGQLACNCKPKGSKPTKPKFDESDDVECTGFSFPSTLEAKVSGSGTKLKKGKGLAFFDSFVFTCEAQENNN